MKNFQKTQLTFEFNTVEVHGKTMSLCILANDQIIQPTVIMPSGVSVLSYDIKLPAKITLITGNRDDNGTIVDHNNNIVKNMMIAVNAIRLDGLSCWSHWIEHTLITEVDNSDDVVLGSCICVNGKIDIFFNQPTAFHIVSQTKIF